MMSGENYIEPRKGLFLGDITKSLLETAVKEKWFDNGEINRVLGFGKGVGGCVEFKERFQEFIHGENDTTPMGIYLYGRLLGSVAFR